MKTTSDSPSSRRCGACGLSRSGVSISIDELAIGFTLGLLRISAVLVIALIAVQTLVVTQLGLRLGGRLSEQVREGAERLAGLALATLGLVLLAEKLLT
jgi:putative Mn2+ efflux pump MntP